MPIVNNHTIYHSRDIRCLCSDLMKVQKCYCAKSQDFYEEREKSLINYENQIFSVNEKTFIRLR